MPRVFSSGKEAVIKELITTNLFFFLSGWFRIFLKRLRLLKAKKAKKAKSLNFQIM